MAVYDPTDWQWADDWLHRRACNLSDALNGTDMHVVPLRPVAMRTSPGGNSAVLNRYYHNILLVIVSSYHI